MALVSVDTPNGTGNDLINRSRAPLTRHTLIPGRGVDFLQPMDRWGGKALRFPATMGCHDRGRNTMIFSLEPGSGAKAVSGHDAKDRPWRKSVRNFRLWLSRGEIHKRHK